MKKLVAALLFSVSVASAQVQVTLKPISLVTTRKSLGKGRAAGYWTVALLNQLPVSVVVARELVMSAAPALHDLPNALAEDVIGRQVASNPRSWIGTNGDALLGLGASGVALGGFATGSRGAEVAGFALAGLQVVFRLFAKQAPDATPYFSNLLPAEVPLGPGRGATFGLFASVMKDAQTIQAVVVIPSR